MKNSIKQERLGFLAVIAGAGCIGLAPIWVRFSELGPVSTAFHRLLLALPMLWLWQTWDTRPSKQTATSNQSKPSMKWFALTGVLFALDMAFWHESLHHTTVANATLLTNAAPIFVVIAARFLFNERITHWFIGGMFLTLLGAILLTGASFSTSKERLYGDMIAIVAAVFYGGYMLSLKHLRKSVATASLMARSGIFSAIALGVFAVIMGEPLIPKTIDGWLILFVLALTGQVLGQGLIAYGFAHLPASFSAVSLLFQPLVAAVAAWVLLHESMSLLQMLGGVVILSGIILAKKSSKIA
ncbi:MAG: DMT family transporter [Verrucomicrobia bacterium]|nr:DMT family transporter [Verrucomicrobiota bacterium]